MYRIWVDDIRPMPNRYNVSFKTASGAIDFIVEHWTMIDEISLDHDSGDFGPDYITILDYLDEHFHKVPANFKFHFHSANPVGVANMKRICIANGWTII